jgi:hypothetical protein
MGDQSQKHLIVHLLVWQISALASMTWQSLQLLWYQHPHNLFDTGLKLS